MDSYREFDKRLEDFIDKYYRLSVFKGIILFIVLCSTILLALSYLEFVAWFNNSTRLFLLLVGLVSSFFIFYYFLIVPLLRYFGFLNRITKRKTEEIIRENLPHIKDYVLNIIELKELGQKLTVDNELLVASITQKIQFTSEVDFKKVLTTRKLYPLIKYFITIVILYVAIFILKPTIFTDGSSRIIHFNTVYNKSVGYTIILNENIFDVEKGSNLYFSAKIEGDKVPEYLSYFIGSNEFLMTKKDSRNYYSTIKSINKSFSFRIGNEQYKTPLYNVNVIQPPFLDSYTLYVQYPYYTNKKNDEYDRISNIKVPIGSSIKWRISSLNTDSIIFSSANIGSNFSHIDKFFYFDSTIYSSCYYTIIGKNKNIQRELIPKSFISIIPDLYPDISVIQVFDDNNKSLVYFKGHIYDDYGFTNLYFVVNDERVEIPINSNINNQEYFYSYEFEDLSAKDFTYYFEVFDNDAINGNKSSKSIQYSFVIPDYLELAKYKDLQDKEIFNKMEKSLLLAEEFKRDIQTIKEKLFSEKLTSFEKQQLIEDLTNKQNILEQMLSEISNQNQNKNKQFDSFNEKDEQLLKKQDEIQKLFDSVMTDELKALFNELEKLNLEYNKNDLNKHIDKLQLNYEQLSEQLDRNLELLKKFEIEKNLDQIANEIENIGKSQELLSKQDNEKTYLDSIINQDSYKLSELKKQYNIELDKNSNLKEPFKLDDLENQFQDLEEEITESKDDEQLNDNEKKVKFSENSKKAKELSEKIDEMINNNRTKENGENSETLRQILENLIYFSFTQESINEVFVNSSRNNPNFFENVKRQNDLIELYSIINDSLLELSKRTPELGNHISKKANQIEMSLFDINSYFKEFNLGMCRIEQRKVMELSNDLILLLSESLKNMENSGEGAEGSQKKKNKPKQSKPSLAEMRKSQESIKNQLESMIKKMKEGKPGSGKPSSEQLGKMLAQQEMFQQMINQLQNEGSVGQEFQKKLNEINQLLEQNKRDLIRSNIDQVFLNRQNQIVTRLLEAEKSEMERDLDEQRKSKEANIYLKSNPDQFFQQENININFNDILNSNSIKLNYFYKNKYQIYIKNLN